MPRANTGAAIKVDDLKQFGRDLKALNDSELSAEFRDTNVATAEFIVDRARVKAQGEGRMAQAAAKTMRAVKSKVRAEIVFGGARAPFAAGSEFGSRHDKKRTRSTGTYRGFNQFRPWRGNDENAGYWLYPTVRANAEQVAEMYGEALDKLTEKAFPT